MKYTMFSVQNKAYKQDHISYYQDQGDKRIAQHREIILNKIASSQAKVYRFGFGKQSKYIG